LAITDDGAVTLSPEVFSPDNDGYDDVLNISYTFDHPGYVANIVIFDGEGRQIRDLITNELLGTTGIFSWDGITNDKEKANIGIYVIWFEVFDIEGNVKRYKRTAVLAGRYK
jgi:flagellar hook assembly protein FlgD